MSIPTPFNPLGTLGAVRELPYVQPVKTGYGINQHSNNPSFGFEVSETGYTQSFYPWKAFLGESKHGAGDCWLGEIGAVNSAFFTFAKPIKIESLLARRPSWGDTKMILYGLEGDAGHLLGTLTLSSEKEDYRLSVADLAYYARYQITIESTGSNFPSVQDIRLNAVYKA